MRILAVDVGTGTQDILLFDSAQSVENALQLIMPSPTQIAAGKIRRATEQRRPVALTGVIAGGGPCHWALENHLRAGLAAYATPEAAATFDDDLDNVRAMGVTLVSGAEIRSLPAEHVRLRDLDLDAIRKALAAFDVDTRFDGLALGCLDHGASPPGYSDRLFRFDHLRRVVEQHNDLRAFAYLSHELPDYLTRARTLVACADAEVERPLPVRAERPLPARPELLPAHAEVSKHERSNQASDHVPTVFLDTGAAAALGALQDPAVGSAEEQLVLNLGNMHALAFHLRGTQIISLYEHHTGELTREQIEDFTERLIAGDLPHEDVFNSKGHGVYYATNGANANAVGARHTDVVGKSAHISQSNLASNAAQTTGASPLRPGDHAKPLLAVTGPQRGKLRPSRLNPYFAVPHGDMMVSGCFGLLWAFAEKHPDVREEVLTALGVASREAI